MSERRRLRVLRNLKCYMGRAKNEGTCKMYSLFFSLFQEYGSQWHFFIMFSQWRENSARVEENSAPIGCNWARAFLKIHESSSGRLNSSSLLSEEVQLIFSFLQEQSFTSVDIVRLEFRIL